MKTSIVKVLLGFSFLLYSHTATSAVNYDPSASLVEESSILPVGYSSYFLYLDHQRFGSSYGGQADSNLVAGFRVGLRERMEVGLTLPVRSNLAENSAGLVYVMANVRFELASYNQGQSKLFLSIYRSSSELQGAPAITSGNPNQGFYLSLFDSNGRFEKRYLLGSGRADTRIYTGVGSYVEYRRYILSAGARFGQVYNNHIWLDFILRYDELGATQNSYAYIAPTFEFPKPNGRTTFIGVAFGVPIDKAAPHTQIVYGMRFNPTRSPHVYSDIPATKPQPPAEEAPQQDKKTREQTPVPATPPVMSTQAPDIVNINGGSPGSQQQAQGMNQGGASTTPPASDNTCKATIEIMYFTGQKQRAEKLAEELKVQGYCVNDIIAQDLSILESELYVRRDTNNELIAEVKGISGARQYSYRQLPWGVDMRIILGKY